MNLENRISKLEKAMPPKVEDISALSPMEQYFRILNSCPVVTKGKRNPVTEKYTPEEAYRIMIGK